MNSPCATTTRSGAFLFTTTGYLFEFLILEGAQAGLSWDTILRKRHNYRRAYDNFEPSKVARYSLAKMERLLQDDGIVRNRSKVEASVINARAVLDLEREYGSFDTWVWEFTGGSPIVNRRRTIADIPATSEQPDAMSKALKKRGFKFVGSTICYAFMQAVGMVNDHETRCFRHAEVKEL